MSEHRQAEGCCRGGRASERPRPGEEAVVPSLLLVVPSLLLTQNLLSGPSAQSRGLGQDLRGTVKGAWGPPSNPPAHGKGWVVCHRTETGAQEGSLKTRKRAEKGEMGCIGQGGGWNEAERDGETERGRGRISE